MRETRENGTYLPGIRIPDGLAVTSSLAEALEGARIVFMAVPSHGFRAVLAGVQPVADGLEAVVEPGQGH